jgi:hypothetical protein
MFLNEDENETSSQWTYAFSTFVGAAVLLSWVGMTFGASHFKTEPWDPIDPIFSRQAAPTKPAVDGKKQAPRRR